MRIMIIQHAFHANSAGMVLGLQELGHEVRHVAQVEIAMSASADARVNTSSVVVPYTTRSIRKHGKKGSYQKGNVRVRDLWREVSGFRPDVVIARGCRPVSLVAFLLAKVFGATPVMWLMKPRLKCGPRILRPAINRMLPKRRFHSGYSGQFGQAHPLSGGPSTLLGLPTPWPEVAPFPPGERRVSEGPVRLLVVSSLGNPVKRVDWAVQAVAAARLDDRVVLTFVGDSESPAGLELKRQARELGVREPSFIPPRTDRWLDDVMREHDVLVHPSKKEVYGSVIPEAMSAGLVVICSDRCGAAVSVEDGTNGMLFRSESFDEFTDAVARSVHDSALRNRMAAAATAFAEANLTPRVWAGRFEELLGIKDACASESHA